MLWTYNAPQKSERYIVFYRTISATNRLLAPNAVTQTDYLFHKWTNFKIWRDTILPITAQVEGFQINRMFSFVYN